jgi:hypothetical protein
MYVLHPMMIICFDLVFLRQEGRHANAKAQEAIDHLTKFDPTMII